MTPTRLRPDDVRRLDHVALTFAVTAAASVVIRALSMLCLSSLTRFGRPPRGSWRSTAAGCGRSRRSTRWRPGVVACRTGGRTPGRSVVRLASGGDRLTFAGDAVFQVAFDRPDWFNGFEHDPEEAARVRVRLLRELAATREARVATHLPFPSICHVAVAGNAFRGVPAVWDY